MLQNNVMQFKASTYSYITLYATSHHSSSCFINFQGNEACSFLPFLCAFLRMHSLSSPLLLYLYLLAHSYSTFFIPLPTFMNKILLQFSCISHMPPHLSLFPWIQSYLSYPATDATPHILPDKHRSSSSRQFFLTLLASRENRNSNQEHHSLGEKTKSLTSKTHHKHPAEALPKPPHNPLSAAFSLKLDTAWHATSFLAFSSSSRSHYSFHTSSFPELHRPTNNQAVAGAWEVRPWWQTKQSSACPQTKTL